MEDEVSGSDSDFSLSVTYLRAVLLAEMSERLHRLVYRRTLKNITKQSETNKSTRRRNKKFIEVRAEYLYLKAILYNFRSYENLNLCHFSFLYCKRVVCIKALITLCNVSCSMG